MPVFKKKPHESGSVSVEFLLIFPLLLTVFLGIFYFSVYIVTVALLRDAAAAGVNSVVVVELENIESNDILLARVNNRISSRLSVFPGKLAALQMGVFSKSGHCGNSAGAGFVCIRKTRKNNQWIVVVRLNPRFSDLWPNISGVLPFFDKLNIGSGKVEAVAYGRVVN